MPGKTIAEKIFSAHSGTDAFAGDIVVADVDFVMGQDGTSPLAIRALERMGVDGVFDPAKVALVIDHSSPSPIEGVSALHTQMREWSRKTGVKLYDIGQGVCHQLIPEQGHVVPGDLMVGCDSHTCTYGALNVFSTGVGSTDGAAAMAAGKLWFKVPETMKVVYTGALSPGVFSKDLVLYLAGQIGVDGATYEAIEFHGPVIDDLSVDARMTISNMAIEVGAKAGLMKADEKTLAWFEGRGKRTPAPVDPDADAIYAKELTIDAGDVGPQIARPHAVDNVSPIEDVEGTPIAQGVLGT
ncbi:MAG: aconitase family protein, partial [Actinomycetota bacterium]|nr:aconitase family protein [Actinomycetota bacterium]